MFATAVVLEQPERLSLRELGLGAIEADDLLVDVDWSGISTGTERLLWTGRMPSFPGMGYPLVPGYEAIGCVVDAGVGARSRIGERVFVPGSSKFIDARGLFGGSAQRLITASSRAATLPTEIGESGVLVALAATALHAIIGGAPPELIVGAGVLGRLLSRVAVAQGAPAPTLWDTNPARQSDGAVHPEADPRRDYRAIYDASGDSGLLDALVGRLARGGEIVLAGFYDQRLSFAFPPAFQKEARLRIAAEFTPGDVAAVLALVNAGALSLDGLVTHRTPAASAGDAYATAFGDPACLKMVLDWRGCA